MKDILNFAVRILLISLLFHSCKKDKPDLPVLNTAEITGITTTTAVSGGDVTDDGGGQVASRGICWNTTNNPVVENNTIIVGGNTGPFTCQMSGLEPNKTYFVRAYATNTAGTSYGKSISFKTLGDKPVSISGDATNITISSATLNGSVNCNSLSVLASFEYGKTIEYGTSVPVAQNPLSGNTSMPVNVNINNLSPATIYHFRIKSENMLGITYSDDHTLNTLGNKPVISSSSLDSLTTSSSILNVQVNPNYFSTTLEIEYGISNNYGNIAFPGISILTGNSVVSVNTKLSGLTPGTKYFYRIKAQNELGITYSNEGSFSTYNAMDADNNGYYSIHIGTQEWITRNLFTTHFQNGDAIPKVTIDYDWSALSSPGFCIYKNDNQNTAIYGYLYNFYVAHDNRNVCPAGWHVPSYDEWNVLINYLGGDIAADTKIREAGTLSWFNDTGATNSTGFTMLAAGNRESDGDFFNLHSSAYVWSSSERIENGITSGWLIGMGWNTPQIRSNPYGKQYGASIRCLKN